MKTMERISRDAALGLENATLFELAKLAAPRNAFANRRAGYVVNRMIKLFEYMHGPVQVLRISRKSRRRKTVQAL